MLSPRPKNINENSGLERLLSRFFIGFLKKVPNRYQFENLLCILFSKLLLVLLFMHCRKMRIPVSC